MADGFEIIDKAIGQVIEIEEHVPVWKIPLIFGKDFKRIASYIQSQNAEVIDMPYGLYQDMDWEREVYQGKWSGLLSMFRKKWHLVVGMVSSKALPGSGAFIARNRGVQKYVKAIHMGPYQECTRTYKALLEWSRAQGLSLQNEVYEFYANNPKDVPKAEIKTIILAPIK